MAAKKDFPYRAALVACGGHLRKSGGIPCPYGCTGCGACIEACGYGAISFNIYKAAEVDESRCTACGMCVDACPQKIIHIHDCANTVAVKCSNRDRGEDARRECEAGCIGCGICETVCTAGAIKVISNCAVIDEKYCLSCGMCAAVCPTGAVRDLKGIILPKTARRSAG